jgi:hypothetical protein
MTLVTLARRRPALAVLLVVCTLSVTANAAHPRIITFNAPGAGKGSGQGTFPVSVNPAGVIAGRYVDANNALHGFVRTPHGTIRSFDVSDAGTAAVPWSMNPVEVITAVLYIATGLR